MVTGNWILCSYFTCRLIPDGASSINQVYRKYGKMGVGSKIVRIIRLESKRWWQISRQSCRRNCPRRSAREAACNTDLICFRKHTFHAAVGGGVKLSVRRWSVVAEGSDWLIRFATYNDCWTKGNAAAHRVIHRHAPSIGKNSNSQRYGNSQLCLPPARRK